MEMTDLRLRLLQSVLEVIETLTGEQVVAVMTVDDDEFVTPWFWALQDEHGQRLLAELDGKVWNGPKSL